MSLRRVLERVGPWPRRALAIACLLLAGVTAIDERAPHDPPAGASGSSVVVAARDLPAGHTIAARDLRLLRITPAIAGASRSPTPLVGRLLAGPLARGEPITRTRLVSPQLADGLPTGTVAMPIAVDDDVRGFVTPGSRVDLVATSSDESSQQTPARRVAAGILVLAMLPNPSGSGDAPGSRLLLAVGRQDAVVLASTRAREAIVVVASTP